MSSDPLLRCPRRLVLLPGEPQQTSGSLVAALSGVAGDDVLWVADAAPSPLRATPATRVTRWLGAECRVLVFNACDGLDPDALAAACGTLRGGGDCIVLCPPLDQWPEFADPYRQRLLTYPLQASELRRAFLQRLAACWRGDPDVAVWCRDADIRPRIAPRDDGASLQLTEAQSAGVARVIRVARGHARRPLVLTADRGRGKSTLLGVALARLLLAGFPRITVVAPHAKAVETLLRHGGDQAGITRVGSSELACGEARLFVRSPEQCLADDAPEPGLVIVDEAASLSLGVLRELLDRSNRLVFATTEQGYEGSGRGFALRFERLLRAEMPQFQRMSLEHPIRWSADDPLERLMNDSLLLNADLVEITPGRQPIRIELIGHTRLSRHEDLLRAVFGLLVSAHYQTRPSDLRRLLDDPQWRLWVAFRDQQLLGVLLAANEGGFDPTLQAEILAGLRRPRGHLLPQSLSVHAGLDTALAKRLLRVVRIAVHPDAQRQGLGTELVDFASRWAQQHGVDAIGCAYGLDDDLLAFWSSLGLQPARLGLRIDPASAAHTLFMLKGLSASGQELATEAAQRFRADLPWALGDALSGVPPVTALALLRGRDCADLRLDDCDWRVIQRLAAHARDPATAASVLWRCLVCEGARSASSDLAPLLARQVQHWPIDKVCRYFGLSGKAGFLSHLRQVLSRIQVAGQQHG
jgi:tRNA(Met) cytidine acetyltransferase